jgi:enoyl-CoA hydratase/carnithine racemase
VSVVLVEDRGAVRILTMNRPEKRNALNTELTQAILDALRAADAAEAVGAQRALALERGREANKRMRSFRKLR